jgi:D-3-phosphoglycerate dehydrogenase / 2-oxoglutarate reductase
VSRARDAIVLVTSRSYRDADPVARARLERAVAEVRYNERGRALSASELAAELTEVDGVIAGLDRFDATAIAGAPRLRAIARYGVGTDNVDLAAAERAGVVVTNTPEANAIAVAEFTLGLILALLRRLTVLDRRVRDGRWAPERGAQLAGSVVGLLGLGRVGAAVAARASALGARVLAHDPYREPEIALEVGAELVARDQLLARSRILSLHLPLTVQTRDLVDAELLAALPPGALLVNTARGELVVEEDLAAALDSGRLAGAALDSLRAEPPPPGHPLLRRDETIVTPHAGAQTAEARSAMAEVATEELLRVLDGEEPRHRVQAAPQGAAP